MSNIEPELKQWLHGAKKTVIAGIGNPIRGDDYVGLKIVEDMHGKVRKNTRLLECETVPESFLLDIEEFNPSHVLLVDAALLGLNPGEARLVEAEKIVDFSPITTHVLPIRVFCQYITQVSGAKIAFLLIQPKCTEFSEGLSQELSATAQSLTQILIRLLA
jgi:hydrogenase 3 maturation protease